MTPFPFKRGLDCIAPDGWICQIELHGGRYVTAYVYHLHTWVAYPKDDPGWKLL